MQENNSSGNIKNILDGVAEENRKNQEALNSNEPSKKIGLVFDDSEDDAIIDTSGINLRFINEEKKPEEKPKEFSIPEKFEEAPIKKDVPVDNGPRVYTTYVPTFTGVSDNYRMINDPRPLPTKKATKKDDATAEFDDDLDPTAELDASHEVSYSEVNEVISNAEKQDNSESSSTVFKFDDNGEDEVVAQSISNAPEKLSEQPIEEAEEEEAEEEVREYVIPDPVAESTALTLSYASAPVAVKQNVVQETPDGIGDKDNLSTVGAKSEYTLYSQRDSVKDKFLDAITSIRVRFFAAVSIAFILLILESLYTFGVDIPKILNIVTIPGAMALLDIQFALGIYLIALPETISAFKNLLNKNLCPEISITVSFLVNLAYTIVITVYSPAEYPLFGLLFSMSVIAAIGATYFRKTADFEAFKLISKNGVKNAVDRKYTRTLERENAALDGVVEEHKSKISRLFSTVFVSDFFARAGKCSENTKNNLILLASSFGSAVVVGCIAFFVPGGAVSAFSAFALVFMLAFPAISIMSKKLPYYYSEKEAIIEKSAVIGENALIDYSGVDVITFDDTDVFGAEDVTIQRIMLYGKSENLSKALRQMSALFMNVGGPLDRLFSDALDRKCPPADATVIEDMGIRGEISSHPVMAGTLAYMRKNGVKIPIEELNKEALSNSTKVIYAAEDGEVYAKFYIRYSFSEEFSMLLPTLYDDGIKLLIYTRDPNITNDLLRTLTPGLDKIRVMRKYNNAEEECVTYNKISAGMITLGDKTNAINMILLAKKYARLQNKLSLIEEIAMITGAALAVLFSFAGLSLVTSIALAAWQAAWCGALHFVSAKALKTLKNTR